VTWRLVLGVIYVQRWPLLSMIVMMAALSRMTMREWLVGGAMTLLAVGASFTAQGVLSTRALALLPVGPRQMHRAVWILPARLRPPTTPDMAARFEGMWVPMRGVAAQALVWTIVMLIFLAVVQRLRGVVTITWPFDSSMTDLRFLTTIGVPMMFLLGLCPTLAPWIGMLKRLPLSSRRAALLLSLAPTTLPIAFWTVLLVIHLLATAQAPDALRLGQLALFIGLVALVDGLGTKSGSSTARLMIGFPVLVLFTYGMVENRELVAAVLEHWTLPLIGALCLGLAWVVNFHTLTRSAGSARAFHNGRPTQTVGTR